MITHDERAKLHLRLGHALPLLDCVPCTEIERALRILDGSNIVKRRVEPLAIEVDARKELIGDLRSFATDLTERRVDVIDDVVEDLRYMADELESEKR